MDDLDEHIDQAVGHLSRLPAGYRRAMQWWQVREMGDVREVFKTSCKAFKTLRKSVLNSAQLTTTARSTTACQRSSRRRSVPGLTPSRRRRAMSSVRLLNWAASRAWTEAQ